MFLEPILAFKGTILLGLALEYSHFSESLNLLPPQELAFPFPNSRLNFRMNEYRPVLELGWLNYCCCQLSISMVKLHMLLQCDVYHYCYLKDCSINARASSHLLRPSLFWQWQKTVQRCVRTVLYYRIRFNFEFCHLEYRSASICFSGLN